MRIRSRLRTVLTAAACIVTLMAGSNVHAQTADQFFAGDTLDDLWIHINGRDWDTLRTTYQENTFYPCDVQWRTVRVYNAGCRSRGSGSRSATKPGLDVDFDRFVTGQTFLGLSNLVIDNLWQDPSMLQEPLTMWLFRRVGVAAPREAHLRLYVGSARAFAGLYTAVEAIDATFVARAFGDRDPYIYEYRWRDVYHFEDLGFDLEPYALRFAARTHPFESMFALYAPIRELVSTINEAPIEGIADSLDLSSLAAQLAVENYVSDWDGLLGYAGLNNFYLSRVPGAPMQVIPWDKDAAFVDVALPPWHNVEYNVLARKLWADPGTMRRYIETLLALTRLGEQFQEELERQYGLIADTALADPQKPVSNDQFRAAVESLRQFVRDRPAVVRGYLRQVAPDLREVQSLKGQGARR